MFVYYVFLKNPWSSEKRGALVYFNVIISLLPMWSSQTTYYCKVSLWADTTQQIQHENQSIGKSKFTANSQKCLKIRRLNCFVTKYFCIWTSVRSIPHSLGLQNLRYHQLDLSVDTRQKKHVLIGCQTWHALPPNIWSLTAVKANCCAKGNLFMCFWSAHSALISFFSTFRHISYSETAHLPPEIILNV